jgi:broad specificity phosphatase PhoE
MNSHDKYLKYKAKYLLLKNNMEGGGKQEMVKIIFVRHGEATHNIAVNERYDTANIVLTDKGREQATKTGEYLNKVFGKFDEIYTSPLTRCVQTSDLIAKEINYDSSKTIVDGLLTEVGAEAKTNGWSHKEEAELVDKNKKAQNLFKEFENEIDPYKKPYLMRKYIEEYENLLGFNPTTKEAEENCEKFLNKLKKSKAKKILVISHGQTIDIFQKMICNIDKFNHVIFSSKICSTLKELAGNCCIMCTKIENNKYELVVPRNTNHLS